MSTCLSVQDLHVSFAVDAGMAPAVRGVSLNVETRQTLGLVGESGCGKSVSALAIMRLISQPPGHVEARTIMLGKRDLMKLDEAAMQSVRGGKIAMIFQDPMTSLNPVFTCGAQVREAIELHRPHEADHADDIVLDTLGRVGIPDPLRTARAYPHQLSGGMRQRVMIAMALSCRPDLLIADEPTTALDVTVQAKILDLLLDLQESLHMSMIVITHDLGIVSDISHQVLVMYAGLAAEFAPTRALFASPLHPYTQSLLATIPYMHRKQKRLAVIPGEVPNPLHLPAGCPFHPRCPRAFDRCRREIPQIYSPKPDQQVRCFLYA